MSWGLEYSSYSPPENAVILGQDDDYDYEESGWVAFAVGNRAYIGHYSHCSCYGTWDNITENWSGSIAALIAMAKRKADPDFPEREADHKDYDYDHLTNMYKQVLEWYERSRIENESSENGND